MSHLSGLFARKKGTGQVPFSSAAIFYEAISAVKTFLKTEGHLHHERRDVCVSDKQDENCFESSENRSVFLCPIALMPMETIGSTGTVLKKITGQSSCKSVGSMIE